MCGDSGVECVDLTDSSRQRQENTVLNIELKRAGHFPAPSCVKIFGPYSSVRESLCYFEDKKPFEINNISAKVLLNKTSQSQPVFKEKYRSCTRVKNNFFGSISHIYHVLGNMHYQNISSLICLKGFKRTEDMKWMIREVVNPDITQDTKITINMLSVNCALGVHVDISDDCMLRRMALHHYGGTVSFKTRHDDCCNIVHFSIDNIPLFFAGFNTAWSGHCTSFSCSVTKNGIMTVRISWSERLEWEERYERITMEALDFLAARILDLV